MNEEIRLCVACYSFINSRSIIFPSEIETCFLFCFFSPQNGKIPSFLAIWLSGYRRRRRSEGIGNGEGEVEAEEEEEKHKDPQDLLNK